MIDVGCDHGPAACYLVADKLRRNSSGDVRSPGIARMLRAKHRLQSLVLANCDELHCRGDDSLPRVVQLSHIAARLGAEWLAQVGKAQRIQLPVSQPQTAVVRRN